MYDEDGRLSYFEGFLTDITERKRAEAATEAKSHEFIRHYDEWDIYRN